MWGFRRKIMPKKWYLVTASGTSTGVNEIGSITLQNHKVTKHNSKFDYGSGLNITNEYDSWLFTVPAKAIKFAENGAEIQYKPIEPAGTQPAKRRENVSES